jgi:hypothetical protein
MNTIYYSKYIKYKTKYRTLLNGGAYPDGSPFDNDEYKFANFIKCNTDVNRYAANIFFFIIKKAIDIFPVIKLIQMLEPSLTIDDTNGKLYIINSGFANTDTYKKCVIKYISDKKWDNTEKSDDDIRKYINDISDKELKKKILGIYDRTCTNEATEIIDFIKDRPATPDELYYNKMHGKFHQMIGGLYEFIKSPTLIHACVIGDVDLRNECIEKITTLYCLPKMNFEDFITKFDFDITSSTVIELIRDVFISNGKATLFSENLLYAEYNKKKPYHKINEVDEEHMKDSNSKNYKSDLEVDGIQTGNSKYDIGEVLKKIFTEYNRPFIVGTGSSAFLLYKMVFIYMKKYIPQYQNNNILLLLCSIGHYVPYGHTISEILLALSLELELNYTLDKSPIEFILDLIRERCPKLLENNFDDFDIKIDCYNPKPV